MDSDVEQYFLEQYTALGLKVVPGHWPDFKTREEVDLFIEDMNAMAEFSEYLLRKRANSQK